MNYVKRKKKKNEWNIYIVTETTIEVAFVICTIALSIKLAFEIDGEGARMIQSFTVLHFILERWLNHSKYFCRLVIPILIISKLSR